MTKHREFIMHEAKQVFIMLRVREDSLDYDLADRVLFPEKHSKRVIFSCVACCRGDFVGLSCIFMCYRHRLFLTASVALRRTKAKMFKCWTCLGGARIGYDRGYGFTLFDVVVWPETAALCSASYAFGIWSCCIEARV